MKKQLEDLFRESLGKHEMPYDPAAWKAMQKNLPSSGNSFLKIAVASAASVALVTIGYLWFNSENKQAKQQLSENTIIQPTNHQESNKSVNLPLPETTKSAKGTDSGEKPSSVEPIIQPTPGASNPIVKSSELIEQPNKVVEPANTQRKEPAAIPVSTSSNWTKQALQARVKPIPALVCEGDKVNLQLEHIPSSTLVLWSFSDGSTLIGERIQLSPEENLVVTPVLTNTATNEKIELDGIVIQLTSPSKPDFVLSESLKHTKPFFVAEQKSSLKNLSWQIGEKSGNQSKMEFYLTEKGTYTLKLQGIDQNGCKVSASESITITDSYNLFAEKAFSPNGDGLNETFMPKALLSREVEFRMTVHDRSGSLVFESSSVDKPWEGTLLNGEKARVGNYIWAISLINEEGLPEKYSGMIVITEN
jgi:gliding motility-associated-like protein